MYDKAGRKGQARHLWRPRRPGHCSKLPPLCHAGRARAAFAPTPPPLNRNLASPDPAHCPDPIPGQIQRDPNPAPSFFQRTPSRRAPSASAPCSCFPPPSGSCSLVHSTRSDHPISGGLIWVQGLWRGTDCGEGLR